MVAIWGCGPFGQFIIHSAWMMGAGRVIVIDKVPERLKIARTHGRAETLDFSEVKVYGADGDDGRAWSRSLHRLRRDGVRCRRDAGYAKAALHIGTDRPHVLREAIS